MKATMVVVELVLFPVVMKAVVRIVVTGTLQVVIVFVMVMVVTVDCY